MSAERSVASPRWTRRIAIGVSLAAGASAIAGFGVLASRRGASLVFGTSRARPVEADSRLPPTADAVVIGGGNIGCLTALSLAERGLRVVLCEKGVVAGEASGRSLGYIENQFLDPAKMALIGRSKQLWAAMNQRVQADTGYRATGLATFFGTKEGLDAAAGWLDAVKGLPGVDARILGAREAAGLAQGSRETYAGALHQPSDACAEPQWAAPAIAAAARRHGATVLQQCAVRGIDLEGGRVSGVVTEHGRIASPAVVLAGGVWSPYLARTLGLDLPQFMAFSGIVRLEGAAGPAVAMISEAGNFATRPNPSGSVDLAVALGTAPVLPSTLRHLPRLGPAWERMQGQLRPAFDLDSFLWEWRIPRTIPLDRPSAFEERRILMPETRVDALDAVVQSARMAFPGLATARVAERWSGALMSTLDNMPVISPVDSIPGLVIGSGFYYGLTMGPAAGEALADIVTGRTPAVDLVPYRFSRFNDGSPIVFHD